MTTRMITHGDSAFTIAAQMPRDWAEAGATVNVTVADKDGNDLVDSQSATLYTADTTASTITAGTFTTTLTTGNDLDAGDLIIVGSAETGWQYREVDHYDSSTQTLTVTAGWDEDLGNGVAVRGLSMEYQLDASGWDTAIAEVYVVWEPSTDHQDMTQLWQVRHVKTQVSGLQNIFKDRYKNLYDQVNPNSWDTLFRTARNRLSQIFKNKGRNFNLIVDSELVSELYMLEIALMIARPIAIDPDIIARLETDRREQLDIINGMSIWIDDDEDEVEEDEEVQPGMMHNFMRGLY